MTPAPLLVDAALLERVSGRPIEELRRSAVRLARAIGGASALADGGEVLLDPGALGVGPDAVAAVVAPLAAGAPQARLRVLIDTADVDAVRLCLDAGVRLVALRGEPVPAVGNLLAFFRCDVVRL